MENKELLEKGFDKLIVPCQNLIKTGFLDLDVIMSGVDSSALVVIGSRPAMGKTTLLTSIFENIVKQGKRCLFFTLEMSEVQFMSRFIAQFCEVSKFKLIRHGADKATLEKLADAVNQLSELDFALDENSFSISEIEESIRKYKPEFVFIDCLQLIKVNNRRPRCDEMFNVVLSLKLLAKELGIKIFITSQLSRALEARYDKRPMLSDLKETGGIEDLADIVMLLYRDEYYHFEESETNKNLAEIIVAKNKSGPTGVVNLLFRSVIPKFYNPVRGDEF